MSDISDTKNQEIFDNLKVKVGKSECVFKLSPDFCNFPLVQAQNLTFGVFWTKPDCQVLHFEKPDCQEPNLASGSPTAHP
jgi:hypothetical protein